MNKMNKRVKFKYCLDKGSKECNLCDCITSILYTH